MRNGKKGHVYPVPERRKKNHEAGSRDTSRRVTSWPGFCPDTHESGSAEGGDLTGNQLRRIRRPSKNQTKPSSRHAASACPCRVAARTTQSRARRRRRRSELSPAGGDRGRQPHLRGMSRCRRVATNPMRAGKRRITVLLLLHWLADMCPGRTRVPTPRPKSSLVGYCICLDDVNSSA